MKRGVAPALGIAMLAGLGMWPCTEGAGLDPDVAFAAGKACGNGPLSRPRPDCSPPVLPSKGDPFEDCVARINQLRWTCQCLPPLTRWNGGESCANKQAKHDGKRGIHTGFNDGICKPKGRAQNECPAWPSTPQVIDGCLQAMWDEGPGKRFSKHGHYLNMSNRRYEQVACGFAKTADGQIWSVQNFR